MSKNVLSQSFTIRNYEADATGALALHTLCDIFQDAAGMHARALAVDVNDLQARGLTWVLSRLRIRAERLPRAGETVEVRTWPTGVDRLFALRDYLMVDSAGRTLAAGASAWLILDTAARRPVRIQGVFTPPDTSAFSRAMECDMDRLPEAVPGGEEHLFPVRFSDIDWNRHVNNASYVEWLTESVGLNVAGGCRVRSLSIDFLAESVYGDTVSVRTVPAGPGPEFTHALSRAGDGREIARARTQWEAV
jgi:medium-chain acyl-[acyl-carrier-protein] hydrolase